MECQCLPAQREGYFFLAHFLRNQRLRVSSEAPLGSALLEQ